MVYLFTAITRWLFAPFRALALLVAGSAMRSAADSDGATRRRRDAWSLGLRNAGYEWAKALSPAAPVMSCWDDSNNTDIVDHHDYGTAFKSGWATALYSDPHKGAMVTEGGSRWYQPGPVRTPLSQRHSITCSPRLPHRGVC